MLAPEELPLRSHATASPPSPSIVPTSLNALTFEVYAELRDASARSRARARCSAVVITGAGRGFCSGGSVHDIIGPLFDDDARRAHGVHAHDRRAHRRHPRSCASPSSPPSTASPPAPARSIALACDFRVMSEKAKIAFLFVKVGLAGADMGAAWLLPQVVGLGARHRDAHARRAGRSPPTRCELV